ncbi:hypothetical protein [Actinokineospora sp. HUAS TT18]|uniref:hypothetical protein n=1 Tax=Actinokineospora sp. HUAS TT18 TaxID=3447451 RepID=UPI003F5231B5
MSIDHVTRPGTRAVAPEAADETVGRVLAATRIGLGLVFLWAFADKLFGLGYATKSAGAWINGGSPTKGFLGGIDHGPLGSMFRSWAGQAWADWLFMAGLLGVGLALVLGVGLRVAAIAGTAMMLLMWAAEWPLARFTDAGEATRSTNPVLDYHLVYAALLIIFVVTNAGDTWGLGRRIAATTRSPWLR